MPPKRKSRGRGKGKGKGTNKDGPAAPKLPSNDVEMQDAQPGATSSLLSKGPPLIKTQPPSKLPLPDNLNPSASSGLRLSALVADGVKRRPEYEFIDHTVGSPPGFVRRPAPTSRQSNEEGWPHGVLHAGALIRMLEDLSRSSRHDHWQVCIQLEPFAECFGYFHILNGLIVTNIQDMHMIMLAHRSWVDLKGDDAKGDILWVPGLEPRDVLDPNWEANAKSNLPALPDNYYKTPWFAEAMQYVNGSSQERSRKGVLVAEKWKDGAGWERDIYQA
jgi:hypothetical protein